MREIEPFMHTENPIDSAAADWHTRREQGLNHHEEIEFQAWLAANPAHAQALTDLDDSLALLRRLPAERVARLRAISKSESTTPQDVGSRPYSEQDTRQSPRRSSSPRSAWWPQHFRAGVVALCSVSALIAGVVWFQLMQPVFTATYATARGQQFDVPLPDGSNLSLDAATRVEVSFFRHRREVRLMHGQAMFSVAADSTKPFDVLAGPACITVVGTRFAVRYLLEGEDAGSVDVAVEEGHVQVVNVAGYLNARLAELSAGQGLHVSHVGQSSQIASISPNSIAPWRHGLVRFTNTPLSDAIRELERYQPARLVIRDPQVAALRIGGSYKTNNPDDFARVLPQVLPVSLIEQPNGSIEIVKSH